MLYVLAAFGEQVAMAKGERGRRITWIGTTFELKAHKVILGTPKKMVDEIKATLTQWMGKGIWCPQKSSEALWASFRG